MIKNLGAKKLSRTGSHRRAMLSNMAASILLNEQICTTSANAKAARPVIEKIITSAKHNKHLEVRKVIKDKKIYKKLFEVIAPRYANRPGGYTRILRMAERRGDNASMSLLKLV